MQKKCTEEWFAKSKSPSPHWLQPGWCFPPHPKPPRSPQSQSQRGAGCVSEMLRVDPINRSPPIVPQHLSQLHLNPTVAPPLRSLRDTPAHIPASRSPSTIQIDQLRPPLSSPKVPLPPLLPNPYHLLATPWPRPSPSPPPPAPAPTRRPTPLSPSRSTRAGRASGCCSMTRCTT